MKRIQVWRFEMADRGVVEVELVQTRDEPSPLFELTLSSEHRAFDALTARGARTYLSSGHAYTEATHDIAEHGRIERVVEVAEEQFEPAEYAAPLGELRAAIRAWTRQAGTSAAGVDPDATWAELHDQLVASDVVLARQKRPVAPNVRRCGQMLRQAIARYGNIMVWERRRQRARPGQEPRRGEYKWTLRYIQAVLQEVEELRRGPQRDAQIILLDEFRRRRQAV